MKIQSKTNYHLPITNYHLPIMSNEHQTLVHFRHFRHSSSFLTIFPSTTVENPLQIHPFLTNKANFRKSQMNVNTVITMNYEQRTMNYEIKNKANSNPIQSQTKPILEAKHAELDI